VNSKVDWDAGLGVVIGQRIRHAHPANVPGAIAGFVVANDISMRDWQNRGSELTHGSLFEASTPVGPRVVIPEEVGDARDLEIWCEVDGTVVHQSRTADLLCSPAELIAYISESITLGSFDLILAGTPSGVGLARVGRSTPHRGRWSTPASTGSASLGTAAPRLTRSTVASGGGTTGLRRRREGLVGPIGSSWWSQLSFVVRGMAL
jgi:2-keto-4-pentenoate hydratase/2-oxohepta-3-ene-1,7-dioic acid hydratase in catechol pathway